MKRTANERMNEKAGGAHYGPTFRPAGSHFWAGRRRG